MDTQDGCEHGVSWDGDCQTCRTELAEAQAAGALTPNEIGIYFKGKHAAAQAVELSRAAFTAERRAEDAEYHIEQLRDARDKAERRIERAERLIDSWEHDAPEHSSPVFIGRLRECLRRDPAPVRLREGPVLENQVGSIADLHPEHCAITEHSPPESGCDDE